MKVYLDKTTRTRNNWEKWCSKLVHVIYTTYITVLGRTDFKHPIFSIISSQSYLSRWTFYEKKISPFIHKTLLYIHALSSTYLRCRELVAEGHEGVSECFSIDLSVDLEGLKASTLWYRAWNIIIVTFTFSRRKKI